MRLRSRSLYKVRLTINGNNATSSKPSPNYALKRLQKCTRLRLLFSAVKRKLSHLAPDRTIAAQFRQTLLLGLASNLDRLRPLDVNRDILIIHGVKRAQVGWGDHLVPDEGGRRDRPASKQIERQWDDTLSVALGEVTDGAD